jgi:hypothetical protein
MGITGTLYQYLCKFIVSRLRFLINKNLSDKSCRGYEKTQVQYFFPPKFMTFIGKNKVDLDAPQTI